MVLRRTVSGPKYKVFKVVDTQYAQDDDSKSYDVAVKPDAGTPESLCHHLLFGCQRLCRSASNCCKRKSRQGIFDQDAGDLTAVCA
jgi:hypothetical protein